MKRGDIEIYITGLSTSTTASRGGESTGNLLGLNGLHAETSHIVIKKDTMVLVFALVFSFITIL